MTTTKHDKKHLTTTQRMKIEDGLNKGLSTSAIGRSIEKDPTTVSKKSSGIQFYTQVWMPVCYA